MTAPPQSWNVRLVLRILLALFVLHLVLIQPNHPHAVSWWALTLFPLELPVLILALLALGGTPFGQVFRAVVVIGLTLIAAQKAADFAMFVSLNRGFNLVADLPLVVSLLQLLIGALGPVATALVAVAAVFGIAGLAAALWWATGVLARITIPRLGRRMSGVAALCAAGFATAEIGATMGKWSAPLDLPGAAFTARVGVERYVLARETVSQLRAFRTTAETDALAQRRDLFSAVDGDVFVIFVESYGRTSFDTPLFADLHLETLAQAERALDAKGLSMASTFLTAPTQGGQSWLSHASFANGLWVDNQTSYRAVLASGRQTLFHLAAEAGFRTAAVMPQITMEWPEADAMGFDTILAAADLGYQGKPFNWITMPDQFTFAAMDRILRPSDQPLFVQVATGSSHAPWLPVPELLAWEELGDGTVFDPIVEASDPPAIVWKDNDRVRAQYRLAVDYALQTVFAYAERHADQAPLMLVIGDHQAARFVALDERPHVPMHVIGPSHLVDLITDQDFAPGLIPPAGSTPRPMSDLRAHLVRALSAPDIAEAIQ